MMKRKPLQLLSTVSAPYRGGQVKAPLDFNIEGWGSVVGVAEGAVPRAVQEWLKVGVRQLHVLYDNIAIL